MGYAFLAGSAVVPSLLLMVYFHTRDLFPEPPKVLWRTFGLGVVIVLPVLAVAWPLSFLTRGLEDPLAYGLAAAFLEAAIPEELFKLLVLWLYAARRPEFDEPIDGVVYGVAASLGFATLENVAYVTEGGFGVAIMRALTSVPSHAFLGAIMGSYAARARFSPAAERSRWLRRAYLVPVLLHGLYDFPLLAAERAGQTSEAVAPGYGVLLALTPLIVVAEWIWAVRLTRRQRVAQILTLKTAEGRPPTAPGRASSLLLMVGGALAAGLGGLLTLGLLAALAFGDLSPQEAGEGAAALGLLGLVPLAGGGALFLWGIKRLNEASRSA